MAGAGSVSSEKQNRGKASGDRQYPRRRLAIRSGINITA